ncbi:MAG: hypothetical protein L6R38_003703 [Xanthoria sp. 2 TBL-2021]|nr:MAG: hypothetical protein L6R38_003703 [Xanthoria sp. 2 TBL-2021]
MDVACGRILGGTVSAEVTAALSEDFDIEEYLEQRQMPVLHKIVLALAEADLEIQLGLSTKAEINALDYQGRTALSWAAIRGDTTSLNLLLEYGADPNIVALNGDAPLHYATRAPDPGCVKTLVDGGADINAVNAWNVNPLTYTTAFRDDIRYLEPLLAKSIDIDHKDQHGRSALMRAVLNNRPNLVKCLLDNGAKLSEADTWGSHPLMIAVERKFHAVAHIILENGSSALTKQQFSSVLDMAMTSGDHKTANMLERLQARLFKSHGKELEALGADDIFLDELVIQNAS